MTLFWDAIVGYEVPNIGADNHQKKNQVYVNDAMNRNKQTEDQYEAIVQHHGMQKDESTPRLSLPEESVNQKNGPLENPIQLHELASYITEMTMNKDAFKEEFDVRIICASLSNYISQYYINSYITFVLLNIDSL